jgi:hypothetical protein
VPDRAFRHHTLARRMTQISAVQLGLRQCFCISINNPLTHAYQIATQGSLTSSKPKHIGEESKCTS